MCRIMWDTALTLPYIILHIPLWHDNCTPCKTHSRRLGTNLSRAFPIARLEDMLILIARAREGRKKTGDGEEIEA